MFQLTIFLAIATMAASAVLRTRDSSEPCKAISEAYSASNGSVGDTIHVSLPPSIGVACLKSVPVDKTRDLQLLDFLTPFISFQSTLEILADPPEGYLLDGVDILGGLQSIKQKLSNDSYTSQYDVMVDVRSIFAGANDGHFNYPPALLNALAFLRTGLDLVSISKDGISLPSIYLRTDVNEDTIDDLSYEPSPVDSIDGVSVFEALETMAANNVANAQDPDAQFNSLFTTVPSYANGVQGSILFSYWEIPDNYTIKLSNGTSLTIENSLIILPGNDWSGIVTGEDVHEAIEVPSSSTGTIATPSGTAEPTVAPSTTATSPAVAGYPEPIFIQESGAVAGYFLNETGYQDTAVIAILSFLPIGADSSTLTDEQGAAFIKKSAQVFTDTIKAAKKDKRDKLIIDLSANGGGAVQLAIQLYRLLFPTGEVSLLDRLRANEAVIAASLAAYETTLAALLSENTYPINSTDDAIKSGREFAGPYLIEGQNMTDAFIDDTKQPIKGDNKYYYNGNDPKNPPIFAEAPYAAENIVIVTDGICASSCNILTGLTSRTQGVRTIALGGRALSLPMQAMGGTKGTEINQFADLATAFGTINETASKEAQSRDLMEGAAGSTPSLDNAPLLPLINQTSGASVNSHSGYTIDNLEGYPVQFRYEAANCRLFYTAAMIKDPSETWRRVADVAWNQAKCVSGSTVNSNGTIGNTTVAYSDKVRSRVPIVQGPGSVLAKSNTNSTDNSSSTDSAAPRTGLCSTQYLGLILAMVVFLA